MYRNLVSKRRPSVRSQLHFRLLLRNRRPDSLHTRWQCTSSGSLPSLFKWSRSSDFWIFNEFFCSFLGRILKNLLLQNRSPNHFKLTQEHCWGLPDVNLFTRWRCDFFLFFYDFSSTNAIFDFFARTVWQVELKRGGYVPSRGFKQSCSWGYVTMDSWFLTNFSFWELIGIHSFLLISM